MPVTDITSGLSYPTLSAAIIAAAPGDVIQVPAGTYSEDFPKLTKDVTIQGIGGMPTLTPLPALAPGPGDPLYQMPSNGQGILVVDANVRLVNLELTGARSADLNGAGIRFETGSLSLSGIWSHHNENGLLANPGAGVVISIDRSEFDHNGAGDGFSHNIYVNQVARLEISNSYFHDANVGHEIKSRAENTVITSTRVIDGPTAPASYSIDLPNGGFATLSNLVIGKGASAENWAAIHFGGELVPVLDPSALTIDGVTFINDLDPQVTLGYSPFVFNQSTPLVTPTITNSTFYGETQEQLLADIDGNAVDGSGYAAPGLGNVFLGIAQAPAADTSHPWEVPAPAGGPLLGLAMLAGLVARRWQVMASSPAPARSRRECRGAG